MVEDWIGERVRGSVNFYTFADVWTHDDLEPAIPQVTQCEQRFRTFISDFLPFCFFLHAFLDLC